MKPLVCLPMEVKSRDLDGRLYLAMRCAKEGYPVLIGIRARMRRFIRKDLAGPALYISKGNRPAEEIYGPLKKFGGHLFLLDEEGAGSLSYTVHVNHPFVLTQEHVEKIFTWGELQKQYFIQNGAQPEKLKVTGNPRFDLCKPELIDFYRKLSQRLDKPKKYLVVASNQVSANPSLGLESTKRHLQNIFKGRHGVGHHGVEHFLRQRQLDTGRLDKLIDLTRTLAKAFPDMTIVFRPHPAEEMSFYDGLFQEQNILVTREGGSLEWIVDEYAHVHIDCTTGIEAFFVGKEVISYVPQENNEDHTEATLSASTVLRTKEDVVERVKQAIRNNGQSTLSEEERLAKSTQLEQLFANVGKDASTEIINSFPTHEEDGRETIPSPKSWLYRSAKKLKKKVRGNRLNELDLRAKSKFPGLSIKEVKHKVDVFKKVMPQLPDVDVKEYDIDTFLITPKKRS